MICTIIFCAKIMITPWFAAILAGILAKATSTFSCRKPLWRREALCHLGFHDSNLKNPVYELLQNSWVASTKQTYTTGIKTVYFLLSCQRHGDTLFPFAACDRNYPTLPCWSFNKISFVCNH